MSEPDIQSALAKAKRDVIRAVKKALQEVITACHLDAHPKLGLVLSQVSQKRGQNLCRNRFECAYYN